VSITEPGVITTDVAAVAHALRGDLTCRREACGRTADWVLVEDRRASIYKPTQMVVSPYCGDHRDGDAPALDRDALGKIAADRGAALPFYAACSRSWPRAARMVG